MTQQQLNDLIDRIAELIERRLLYIKTAKRYGMSTREAIIKYNDIKFVVTEFVINDTTCRKVNKIVIDVPWRGFLDKPMKIPFTSINVTYEESNSREIDKENRAKACYELATQFVTDILTKADFEIDKAIYQRNIDKALSVLD